MAAGSDKIDKSNPRTESGNREPKSSGASPPPTTPGRPKEATSRQQKVPDQVTQSGSRKLDAEKTEATKSDDQHDEVEYRDRPSEDGKYGDGDKEPNPRAPT